MRDTLVYKELVGMTQALYLRKDIDRRLAYACTSFAAHAVMRIPRACICNMDSVTVYHLLIIRMTLHSASDCRYLSVFILNSNQQLHVATQAFLRAVRQSDSTRGAFAKPGFLKPSTAWCLSSDHYSKRMPAGRLLSNR